MPDRDQAHFIETNAIEPMTVYVTNGKAWLEAAAWGLLFAASIAGAVVFVTQANALSDGLWTIIFLGSATWVGRKGLRPLRYARAPLPVMRFDGDGLECARGRVRWNEIQSVNRAERGHEHVLVFSLFPGTVWQPVETNYSSVPLRGHSDRELLVVEWGATDNLSLETVNRYHSSAGHT